MGDTTNWLSNVLSDAITTYGSVETAKANNQPSYRYGQPGIYPATIGTTGISPLVLLVGAAVVLVVMLKD
jgi:hypothetical protein